MTESGGKITISGTHYRVFVGPSVERSRGAYVLELYAAHLTGKVNPQRFVSRVPASGLPCTVSLRSQALTFGTATEALAIAQGLVTN